MFQSEALLWLLGSLCSLYRIPFDPKLVEQDFPPPYSLGDRTVMEYLLSPVRRAWHEAGRER